MENKVKEKFIGILKRILLDLHNKNYKEILTYVESPEDFDLLDFLETDIEEILEDYDYSSIDEYGVAVEGQEDSERLQVYEFDDGSGFTIDYILSADEDMMDLVLQLDFFGSSLFRVGNCIISLRNFFAPVHSLPSEIMTS